MRRIALDWLGLYIEVIVAQPPLMYTIDGEEVELRFMFCGVNDGDVDPGPEWESRWVLKGQLRDYEFDMPSRDAVDWMLAD